MIEIREAQLNDVEGIRDVFAAAYGGYYAYPQYYNTDALARLVFADGTVLLVAADSDSQRIVGTASVVFSIGAQNDLVGEFGRLAVHPDFRGRGIGKLLMEGRIQRVQPRLHVGIVDNRTAHTYSQRISRAFGFVPVGLIPMKLLLERRESVAVYVRYFGDALALRRNNPRVIPEASQLAQLALRNCGLPCDAIVDDASAAFPHDDSFQLDQLHTEGYSSLLRIERGRISHRDVFGPIRLHYGLFQLRARQSHYLLARRKGHVAGGIGYMLDKAEKAVRVFELISQSDDAIRFLLEALVRQCQESLGVEYIEIDVSAYAPRMQRTLLEMGFYPVSYIPANVFHEVERLDAVKMCRLLVPFDPGSVQLTDEVRGIAETVLRGFASQIVLPRIERASRQTPLFIGLNDEQRTRVASICTARTFSTDQPIFGQGEVDGAMYLVLSGDAVLQDLTGRTVAEVSAGQCLGESSLLYPPPNAPPHSVTAVAKSTLEAAVLRNVEFLELVRRRPDIGLVIYRNLATDIRAKLKNASRQVAKTG